MNKTNLLNRGKITRGSRGQLPRNYIAGGRDMQRHPASIGIRADSPDDRHKNKGKKK